MISRAVMLVVLAAVLTPLGLAAAKTSRHTGHVATCARQSGASFPQAFTRRANLVVGPLSMIGAGRATSRATVEEFGGNKFPVLVRAGHTVTIELSRRANRSASLFYAIGSGGALTQTRVRDGHRVVTFRACSERRSRSDADGDPVTFWSGFVVVSEPMCVQLKVWIDEEPASRRTRIALGRRC
ncbi:MAG TPA: hypothetical protein VMY78_16180 [Solirubrobacteraceae bacterium]|nr:hypothetical protein [Solirubrobacteraceae bacterium]